MSRPDFIISGAQRAGTTSLHHYLGQHPDIFMSKTKELHFFDTRRSLSAQDLARYAAQFDPGDGARVRGESTPIYMYYPGTLARLRDVLGPVKLVISLRHPVKRAYSHYWHERRFGWEHLPYEQAVQRTQGGEDDDIYLRHHSYIERGLYPEQIRRAEALFGADNVLVVRFEDLVRDPIGVTNTVVQFVDPGLPPLARLDDEPVTQGGLPRWQVLHTAASRLHHGVGRKVVPGRLLSRNLTSIPYPKMTSAQYDLTRQLVLAGDPTVTDLYPDL